MRKSIALACSLLSNLRVAVALLSVLLFSAPSLVLAGTLQDCPTISEPGVQEFAIFFGNGLSNSKSEAALNLAHLRSLLTVGNIELPDDACVAFWDIAYDPDWIFSISGALTLAQQFFASLQLGFLQTDFWQFLLGRTSLDFPWTLFVESFLRYMSASLTDTADPATVNDHISRYQGQIDQCRNVLLVAHSQGNYYGNAAFSRATSSASPFPPDRWRMVSVATPASTIAKPVGTKLGTGDWWATSKTDRIIVGPPPLGGIPGHLAANTDWGVDDLSKSFEDPGKGHSFAGYALSNPTPGQEYAPGKPYVVLKKQIEGALNEMPSAGCFRFENKNYNALPTDLQVTVTVTRRGGYGKTTGQTEFVEYETADGDAIAGRDYVAVKGGVVAFGPDESKKTITITLLPGSTAPNPKSFNIWLTKPGTGGTHLTSSNAFPAETTVKIATADCDQEGYTSPPTPLIPNGETLPFRPPMTMVRPGAVARPLIEQIAPGGIKIVPKQIIPGLGVASPNVFLLPVVFGKYWVTDPDPNRFGGYYNDVTLSLTIYGFSGAGTYILPRLQQNCSPFLGLCTNSVSLQAAQLPINPTVPLVNLSENFYSVVPPLTSGLPACGGPTDVGTVRVDLAKDTSGACHYTVTFDTQMCDEGVVDPSSGRQLIRPSDGQVRSLNGSVSFVTR